MLLLTQRNVMRQYATYAAGGIALLTQSHTIAQYMCIRFPLILLLFCLQTRFLESVTPRMTDLVADMSGIGVGTHSEAVVCACFVNP
jgi:hypothetical protein